jgi:hypothetical protein
MQIPLPQAPQNRPFLDVFSQAAMLPKQLTAADLKNALSQIDVQYAPQQYQAEIGLKNAQASEFPSKIQLNKAQAAHYPFLNMLNAAQANLTKAQMAEYSPEMIELSKRAKIAQMNYQMALTNSMPLRYTTNMGKELMEQKNVEGGLSPTGLPWGVGQQNVLYNPATDQQPINSLNAPQQMQAPNAQNLLSQIGTPGLANTPTNFNSLAQAPYNQQPYQAPTLAPPGGKSPQDISNQYSLKTLKETTDTKARERNLFATNIEKTIGFIKPEILASYSGVKGKLKFEKDRLNATMGEVSPEYMEYNNMIHTTIPLLSEQVRQFYGASIQPSMIEKLEQFGRPDFWLTNPDVALSQFKSFEKILEAEMDTYRDALKTPNVYKSEGQGHGKSSGTVTIELPDGSRGTIPSSQANEAVKRGYKVVQ